MADRSDEAYELHSWLNRLHVGSWTLADGKRRPLTALERVKLLLAEHDLGDVIDAAEEARHG